MFINNPFPIALMKQQSPIRCLDLSARSHIIRIDRLISGHDTQWLLTYRIIQVNEKFFELKRDI